MRMPKSARSMIGLGVWLALLLAGLPLSRPRAETGFLTVTDGTFERQVLSARKPVLLVVMAEWCGPCRLTASRLSELAPRLAGKVALASVDADANPATIARLHITNLPTLILYKGATAAATHVGALSAEDLATWLNQSMGSRVVTPAPN